MRSDLILLEEFGEQLKPTGEHPPAEVRHQVMNGMRQDRPRRALPLRPARWPIGARLAWRIGAPAALAATVAAGLIASNTADVAGNAPSPPAAGGTSAAGRPGGTTAHTVTSAGQVLTLAAQHAEDVPLLDARGDQFVYIESMEVRSELRGRDLDRVRMVGPVRVRTWLSVDGTRDGLVVDGESGRTRLSGCKDGRQAETIDRPERSPLVPCTPEPAYQETDVPTDPDALLAYVYDPENVEPGYILIRTPGRSPQDWPLVKLSAHQVAFQKLIELLYQNQSPAVQAAAFRTAERIPGVELRRGVSDAAGRDGVAVTRTEAGTREELVFDPRTYAFLGHNQIVAEFDLGGATVVKARPDELSRIEISMQQHRRPGDVIQKWAVLRIDIVDEAGQRP